MESGSGQNIARCLIFALLLSNTSGIYTMEASASISSCKSNKSSSSSSCTGVTFPSELREESLAAMQKLYICLGAAAASNAVLHALFHPHCPANGAVGSAENKTAFVARVQGFALAGDWKRFKSTLKTLCRG